MPAFGTTHSDEELWALVAFLRRLPETPPQEYRQMTARAKQTEGGASARAGGGSGK